MGHDPLTCEVCQRKRTYDEPRERRNPERLSRLAMSPSFELTVAVIVLAVAMAAFVSAAVGYLLR